MTWPQGFVSSGVAAGIKTDGALDLGMLVGAGHSLSWAGTFTRNAAAAAPVRWSRDRLRQPVRGVVVNSGNANACTGQAGERATQTTATAAARLLGCSTYEILLASTGPIGFELPIDRVLNALPGAEDALGPESEAFAHSILTTDTVPKVAHTRISGGEILGVAKGAAMLAPNMATMLAFITTDVATEEWVLQTALNRAVRRSFDRISVDACESTNDSVFLFSSGEAGKADPEEFSAALAAVCAQLAEQMVRDAEGSSKFVRVHVRGADTEDRAAALGRAVASSALWRAALYGSDPNWGRVVAALGSCDRSLDTQAVTVDIGAVRVFARGEPTGDLAAAAEAMKAPDIIVNCTVGAGPGWAEIMTSDLSPEYVTLNATGTS